MCKHHNEHLNLTPLTQPFPHLWIQLYQNSDFTDGETEAHGGQVAILRSKQF